MADTDKPVLVIEARAARRGSVVGDLYSHRRFYGFLLREISMKKWRGTVLGFWWLILRPLVPAVIAIITFTAIIPVETAGTPYAVFYLSGFIVWNMLASSLVFMPRTMLWMQSLMKKTYFPRILVPFASIGPQLIELGVLVGALIVVIAVYAIGGSPIGLVFGWGTLLFPLCLLLGLMLGMALGMTASIIALFVKDIVFSAGYIAQMWMFLTPVIYPIDLIPEGARWAMYVFNPMAAVVETGRWALTGEGIYSPTWLAVSAVTILALFAAACWFFRRSEVVLGDAL